MLKKQSGKRVLLQLKHYSEKNSTTLQNSNKRMKMNKVVSENGMTMYLAKGLGRYLLY